MRACLAGPRLQHAHAAPACATLCQQSSPVRLSLCALRPGTYRQLQARLRTNAESVAFYGGIEKEGALIRRSFSTLVAHQASLLATQWHFSMWQVLLPDALPSPPFRLIPSDFELSRACHLLPDALLSPRLNLAI